MSIDHFKYKEVAVTVLKFGTLLGIGWIVSNLALFSEEDFKTPGLTSKEIKRMKRHNVNQQLEAIRELAGEIDLSEKAVKARVERRDKEVAGLPGKLAHKHPIEDYRPPDIVEKLENDDHFFLE